MRKFSENPPPSCSSNKMQMLNSMYKALSPNVRPSAQYKQTDNTVSVSSNIIKTSSLSDSFARVDIVSTNLQSIRDVYFLVIFCLFHVAHLQYLLKYSRLSP